MSNYTPMPLEQATPVQRLKYAREIANLDIDETASDEQVISAIRSAQPGVVNIFVEADAAPEIDRQDPPGCDEALQQQASGGIQGSNGRGDPKAVINIPMTETNKDDVAVGVNGFIWQLKRGMDLTVPWRIVLALRNAEETVIRHSAEIGHEGEVLEHVSQRVVFTLVQSPPQNEIDRWHAENGSKFCP